jgi:hypothetical protein
VQLWIFVLFLVYVTASEFNQLVGDRRALQDLRAAIGTEVDAARIRS